MTIGNASKCLMQNHAPCCGIERTPDWGTRESNGFPVILAQVRLVSQSTCAICRAKAGVTTGACRVVMLATGGDDERPREQSLMVPIIGSDAESVGCPSSAANCWALASSLFQPFNRCNPVRQWTREPPGKGGCVWEVGLANIGPKRGLWLNRTGHNGVLRYEQDASVGKRS